MNWPDAFAVLVLIAAVIYGLRKGFWAELLSILGVGLAIILGAWLTPFVSPLLPGWGGMLNGALKVILFLVVLGLAYALSQWLARKLNELSPDSMAPLSRLGGVVFGLVKGVVLIGLLFFGLVQPTAPSGWRDGAREAYIGPLALGIDIVALDRLSGAFPAFRPLTQILGRTLLHYQQAPGTPTLVYKEEHRSQPDA